MNAAADKAASGKKTLLLSVLMSSPGPLVVGLGLLAGKSSTQLADFFRRSAELLAIILSFVVYCITNGKKPCTAQKKQRLERITNGFVGAAMVTGGIIMLVLALFFESEEKGNVIPGLVIALLGVIANTLFWRKYTRLNKQEPNAILAVQSRLYRAKALVDGCVTLALLSVVVLPGTAVSYYLDLVGSVIVALYLAWSGYKTIRSVREA
ncbi:MAG: transporter [Clostridiales bacterium]|nr:transporter [Clostridiales bacterium]